MWSATKDGPMCNENFLETNKLFFKILPELTDFTRNKFIFWQDFEFWVDLSLYRSQQWCRDFYRNPELIHLPCSEQNSVTRRLSLLGLLGFINPLFRLSLLSFSTAHNLRVSTTTRQDTTPVPQGIVLYITQWFNSKNFLNVCQNSLL